MGLGLKKQKANLQARLTMNKGFTQLKTGIKNLNKGAAIYTKHTKEVLNKKTAQVQETAEELADQINNSKTVRVAKYAGSKIKDNTSKHLQRKADEGNLAAQYTLKFFTNVRDEIKDIREEIQYVSGAKIDLRDIDEQIPQFSALYEAYEKSASSTGIIENEFEVDDDTLIAFNRDIKKGAFQTGDKYAITLHTEHRKEGEKQTYTIEFYTGATKYKDYLPLIAAITEDLSNEVKNKGIETIFEENETTQNYPFGKNQSIPFERCVSVDDDYITITYAGQGNTNLVATYKKSPQVAKAPAEDEE